MQGLSLYQFAGCPFCIKTRRAFRRLNVDIDLRDIRKEPAYREELLAQGGRIQVPCLRNENAGQVRWIYESSDIIEFVTGRIKAAT